MIGDGLRIGHCGSPQEWPEEIDGRSLVPLVTLRAAREPGPAYLESYHPRFWWGARELLGLS